MALTGRRSSGHGKQSGRPLMKVVVTDADLDQESVQLKPLDLDRIVKFFDVPLPKISIERHVRNLKKVAKHYSNGIPLKDLPDVMKILQICAARIEDNTDFIDPVCQVIKLLGLPFLKEKMSDEVRYAETTAKSFYHLGYLMRVPSTRVRMQICSTVMDFYSAEHQMPQIIGFQPTSNSYKIQTAEMSGLAETLVSSLTLMENNIQEKLSVLRTLELLSLTNENCMSMARAQAAYSLCSHLSDPDPSGQLLFLSSGILLNLLDLGPKDDVIIQMNNIECICALRVSVVRLFTNGYKDQDRQLRNDLLVLTTVIAENNQSLIIDSGFARQLILFATFPEIKSRNPLVRNVQLLHNREGLQMKRLLMNILVELSKDWSSAQLLSDGKVISALFTYVKPIEKPETHEWPTLYFEELQLQAMSTLSSVAPRLVEDYMAAEGNKRILQFLNWCCSQDGFVGNGNSFYGTGCRGSKNAQMRQSLKLLQSMVSIQDITLNMDLCDQGAVGQLLGILKKTNTRGEGKDDAVLLEIQSDILSILSSLCDADPDVRDLFGSEGVDVIVQLLRMDPTKIYSGLGHSKLILSTLTCVCSCIIGCSAAEDDFLAKQGVFLLLDLLAVNWESMNTVLLTILGELCDNPKTRSHINTWRGKDLQTAPHMLVQLWKQMEEELGIPRDEYGRIIDVKNPLGRKLQKDPEVSPTPPNSFIQVPSEVEEKNKDNIYSIFSKIGLKKLPGLSTLDFVTLSAIIKHLDFKVADVWRETGREIETENIRPLKHDKDYLKLLKKGTENVAKLVRAQQSKMIEEHQKMELLEEQQRYAAVSCCRVFHVESTPSNLTGGPLADTYFACKRLPIRGGALQKIRGRRSLK
ncbi:cilia- and flagella-associated protein 69-like isoform X2 [Rhinoderma darwinii]|uniref:cilia- and flagella-associated protein 69-like isoform X2 n=1 Tax=Rhinoderma darwinii TaxID=43563 RepID=UPI003F67A24F